MDPFKEKKNCPHFGRCDLLMSDIFHHSSLSLSLSLSLRPQSRRDLIFIFIFIFLRSGRLRLQSRRDPRISDLYHQPGGRAAPRAHPKLPDLVSKVWKLGLGLIRLDRIAGFLLRRILLFPPFLSFPSCTKIELTYHCPTCISLSLLLTLPD